MKEKSLTKQQRVVDGHWNLEKKTHFRLIKKFDYQHTTYCCICAYCCVKPYIQSNMTTISIGIFPFHGIHLVSFRLIALFLYRLSGISLPG